MKRYIYPDIKIFESKRTFDIYTTLRIEHEGEWYFCDFRETSLIEHLGGISEKEKSDIINGVLNRIHRNVYAFMVLGLIDPQICYNKNGVLTPIFEKDKDQITEKERLLKLFKDVPTTTK